MYAVGKVVGNPFSGLTLAKFVWDAILAAGDGAAL